MTENGGQSSGDTEHDDNKFQLPNKVRETLYSNGVALVYDSVEDENLVIKRSQDTETEQ